MNDHLDGPRPDFSLDKELTFDVPGQVMKELVKTRIQLMGAPYLQSAEGGANLQVLTHKDWVDWPSLEEVLTKRMNADLDSGSALSSHQYGLVAYAEGGVAVLIQYLVDDYWWIECLFPSTENIQKFEASTRGGPAAAVLIVAGSQSHLSDTSENHLWFIAEG